MVSVVSKLRMQELVCLSPWSSVLTTVTHLRKTQGSVTLGYNTINNKPEIQVLSGHFIKKHSKYRKHEFKIGCTPVMSLPAVEDAFVIIYIAVSLLSWPIHIFLGSVFLGQLLACPLFIPIYSLTSMLLLCLLLDHQFSPFTLAFLFHGPQCSWPATSSLVTEE